jgi:hypothetical protein
METIMASASLARSRAIHPDIPHDLALAVLRFKERTEVRWPDPADRQFLAARIRLVRVDLRRGDVAAVRRNLAHMEAMTRDR